MKGLKNLIVLKMRLTFQEDLLGTASSDPEIQEKFIISKAPDAPSREEEIAAQGAEQVIERSKTIFPKDEEGNPFIWDYQIKGFLKDSCGALRECSGTESSKIKAYKKLINGLVFPQPRKIVIHTSGKIGSCQRPLRGQTPKGETISLANSETVPAKSYMEFEVLIFDKKYKDWILELFEYGAYRGMGQWRNSGKGRFTVEILEEV